MLLLQAFAIRGVFFELVEVTNARVTGETEKNRGASAIFDENRFLSMIVAISSKSTLIPRQYFIFSELSTLYNLIYF